jgi:Mrp family chromosome partitioning ATPase
LRDETSHGSTALRVHASLPGDPPTSNSHETGGIVVVAPSSLKMKDVFETTELLRMVPTPVVGVITYD